MTSKASDVARNALAHRAILHNVPKPSRRTVTVELYRVKKPFLFFLWAFRRPRECIPTVLQPTAPWLHPPEPIHRRLADGGSGWRGRRRTVRHGLTRTIQEALDVPRQQLRVRLPRLPGPRCYDPGDRTTSRDQRDARRPDSHLPGELMPNFSELWPVSCCMFLPYVVVYHCFDRVSFRGGSSWLAVCIHTLQEKIGCTPLREWPSSRSALC